MGYLAPVDFHQYRQYQNRNISKTRKQNFALERVFRTEFKEIKRQKENQNLSNSQPIETISLYQSKQSKYVQTNHEDFAYITGKGIHFSESI